MPGLHSHLGYSSRLLTRCERDEVPTNVDIHTLVRESLITRQDIRDIIVSFDSGLIYRHVSRASRRNENRSGVWKMRLMYPLHSRSRLVSCCFDENVNQASNFFSKIYSVSIKLQLKFTQIFILVYLKIF